MGRPDHLFASIPNPPAGLSPESGVELGDTADPWDGDGVGAGRGGEGLGPEGTCAVPGLPRHPARGHK